MLQRCVIRLPIFFRFMRDKSKCFSRWTALYLFVILLVYIGTVNIFCQKMKIALKIQVLGVTVSYIGKRFKNSSQAHFRKFHLYSS